jgi:hypothetical protein
MADHLVTGGPVPMSCIAGTPINTDCEDTHSEDPAVLVALVLILAVIALALARRFRKK